MRANSHQIPTYFFCFVVQILLGLGLHASPSDFSRLVEEFELVEVAATLDTELVSQILETEADELSKEDHALAFLKAADIIDSTAIQQDAVTIRTELESDIIFKRAEAAEAFASSKAPEQSKALESILLEAMATGINTGYNIVAEDAWPEFDQDRMIIYGHNRIKHMRQLLFLLRIHDLEPEFEIVPKRSAFILREGWGNTTEETPRLPDGTPVAKISEYDLLMEFETAEDVLRFQDLVTRYAKKDADDEEGLIYRSWWQPFYRSFVPSGAMKQTREIWVSKEGYRANVLSTPEQAAAKEKSIRDLSNEWSISVNDLWVNPSFYRYLLGDYK